MHILIVDDENVIRQGVKRTLLQTVAACSVHLAASPEEAVQVLRTEPIDVVLTDILMPGMTGLELMSISRKRHPNVKWVVISAHSEFAYAQEAVRLGARDYLLKPIGKERLVELVESLADELKRENAQTSEANLLRTNLKYLREAVFQRWAKGLDTGTIDLGTFLQQHPSFDLVMVRLESDQKVQLEHFIIENVLSELIDQSGRGFVTSLDSHTLLGLVTLREGETAAGLSDTLRRHLLRYLKVPFQVLLSEHMTDVQKVPDEVRRLERASAGRVYECQERSGGDSVVEIALQYIRTRFHEELSLEKVASVVFLNPVYFSQLFKQKTGQGFKEYVIQLRLERAKQLLLDPRLKLADIAERIGYADMKHFTQVFRRKYGVTPTEYRLQQEHTNATGRGQ
ncbi:response regulator [Paenibacillus chartarius]|uniref:Response regulator n=1 Tax=Paenibacillus chartarius TaxID=747481 RepID=A0ABV6DGD1_9BACL